MFEPAVLAKRALPLQTEMVGRARRARRGGVL